MLLMFEKGIRGGISTICNRYGKANNIYMEDFNPKEPSKFITYLVGIIFMVGLCQNLSQLMDSDG